MVLGSKLIKNDIGLIEGFVLQEYVKIVFALSKKN